MVLGQTNLMARGLILDTCIPIAAERQRNSVPEMLKAVRERYGEIELGLSTVSVVELTHGIYRARNDAARLSRQSFLQVAFRNLVAYPVSLEIAQLAGRIEGEQAAKGIGIPFEDLVIGSTALYLGFDVLTQNVKHFQLIPRLNAVTL
jgi:tRNA(fMet)-specific endonuclease VapC